MLHLSELLGILIVEKEEYGFGCGKERAPSLGVTTEGRKGKVNSTLGSSCE